MAIGRVLAGIISGMPIGEATRKYGTGLVSNVLRFAKAGEEEKKAKAAVKRARLLKEKKATEKKAGEFKEEVAKQEFINIGKEREAKGLPPVEPKGFLEREKASPADVVFRKLQQRQAVRRREKETPLFEAVMRKLGKKSTRKSFSFEAKRKELEKKFGTPSKVEDIKKRLF